MGTYSISVFLNNGRGPYQKYIEVENEEEANKLALSLMSAETAQEGVHSFKLFGGGTVHFRPEAVLNVEVSCLTPPPPPYRS